MIELSSPLNLQIEITENCNHKCFYCYNSWQLNKNNGAHMSEEKAKKLIDIIYNQVKPFSVALTGGEPLCNMKTLLYLSKELTNNKIPFNINTNLSLFNKERLEQILTNSDGFGILASLPSHKKKEYNFITGADDLDNVFLNLKDISLNSKVLMMINMVVSKYNLGSVYETGKFLYENYNIKNFAGTPVVLSANINSRFDKYILSSNDIKNLFQSLSNLNKDFGINVNSFENIPRCFIPEEIRNNSLNLLINRSCTAGRTTVTIDYQGNVRSCSHDPNTWGNIFETEFSKIWKSLEPFRQDKYVPKECKLCDELILCKGGCRFYDFNKKNALNKKDPRMTKPIINITSLIKEDSTLLNDKKYHLISNTKYRKEKENLFTFFNGGFSDIIYANSQFKDFILSLKKLNTFSLDDLITIYGSKNKEQIERLIKSMLIRHFLVDD